MDGQEYADNFSRFIIIGGGISGLSAASTLAQRGIKDFRSVFEMLYRGHVQAF